MRLRARRASRALLPLLAFALAACSDAPASPGTAPNGEAAPAGEAAATPASTAAAESDFPVVTVYKTPTCGCCRGWVSHLEENGFAVETVDLPSTQEVRASRGVPMELAACHTAVVGGYVVEGHVPADAVQKLLEERPEATGIAVPGMPIGSPGMEQGDRVDPYDVVLFDREGHTSVFAHYGGQG